MSNPTLLTEKNLRVRNFYTRETREKVWMKEVPKREEPKKEESAVQMLRKEIALS
jgi:hypothetical protein